MSHDRSSLLKMGKRPLASAPPVVPLSQLEEEFLRPDKFNSEPAAALAPTAEVTDSESNMPINSVESAVQAYKYTNVRKTVQPDVQQESNTAVHPKLSVSTAPVLGASPDPMLVKRTPGTKLIPKSGRKRFLTVSATFRLPEELHARLKRISQHNQIDMTDITIEALELHLPNFEDPT